MTNSILEEKRHLTTDEIRNLTLEEILAIASDNKSWLIKKVKRGLFPNLRKETYAKLGGKLGNFLLEVSKFSYPLSLNLLHIEPWISPPAYEVSISEYDYSYQSYNVIRRFASDEENHPITQLFKQARSSYRRLLIRRTFFSRS